MTLGYVPDDGYTETGILNESPGVYPRLRFRFRRMTAAEWAKHVEDSASLTESEAFRLTAAHLVGKVVEWDLKDPKGQSVPVSLATVGKLVRALLNRLWAIVSGMAGPDVLEGQSAQDAQQSLEDKIRAASERRPLPEVREEREVKN